MKKHILFTGLLLLWQLVSAQWTQQGSTITGEAAVNRSGESVSLNADGTVVAIGARYNDGNGQYSGHVRVYQFNGVSWNQLGTDIDGEAAEDQSGYSVSLSADGTIVAIGAPYNDGNGSGLGHVRVYQFDGVSWNQLGADIDGEAAHDYSGESVSLNADGTVVAIGAPDNHVRVFQFDGIDWNQVGTDIDGEGSHNHSGESVSLSADGTVVAIGAPDNHVRVFQFDGVNWIQLGTNITGGYVASLSADGMVVATGAPANSYNGTWSGRVRAYQFDGANWIQMGTDIYGEAPHDEYGYSVSLSADGSIVAIGAPGNDGNGEDSGYVRIYEFDGFDWVQLDDNIDGEAAGDLSGWSVSISGDGTTVAIGAPENEYYNNNDPGYARIFTNPSPTPNPVPDPNVARGKGSGNSVTTGSGNTFSGTYSGYYTTEGSGNTAVGYRALFNNTTGSNNTAIGSNARTLQNNLTNTTAIGNKAMVFASNQVRIGNFSVNSIGGYAIWSNLSDGRFKTNVREDVPGLDFIKKLRPVSYEIDHSRLQAFLGEETDTEVLPGKTIGFIAQEVAQLIDENKYMAIGVEAPQNENDHYSIRYAEFVVPLVKAVQEQRQHLKFLEQRIEALEIDDIAEKTVSGLPDEAADTTNESFVLYQNVPNPFDRVTMIKAVVPETVQQAQLVVYDLNGLKLESYPVSGRGNTSVEIFAGRFPSGIYLYALIADDQIIDTKKMILTK